MPRSFFAHSINCRCSVSVRCIVRCGPVVRCKDVRLIRLMARAAEVAKRLHEGNVWGSKRQRRKPAPTPVFSMTPPPAWPRKSMLKGALIGPELTNASDPLCCGADFTLYSLSYSEHVVLRSLNDLERNAHGLRNSSENRPIDLKRFSLVAAVRQYSA
jgi:hypothetical protein